MGYVIFTILIIAALFFLSFFISKAAEKERQENRLKAERKIAELQKERAAQSAAPQRTPEEQKRREKQQEEKELAGLSPDQKADILSDIAQCFGGGEVGYRIVQELLGVPSEASEDKFCPAPSRLSIKPGSFVTIDQRNGQWVILVAEDQNGQPWEIICSDPIPDAILNGKDPLAFSNYLYNRVGLGIDVTRLQLPALTKEFPAPEKRDMLRNTLFYTAESPSHGGYTLIGRAAMLDIAVDSGTISVACINNPSKMCDVSLYHSNGSACIGLGRSRKAIADAAVKVINSAVHAISELEKINYTPRPEPSASVAYFVFKDGVYKTAIRTDLTDELNSAIQSLRNIPEFQAQFDLLAHSKPGSILM